MISIHIAKTGGRSFFEILRNEYGDALDPRFKRKHYFPPRENIGRLIDRIPPNIRVIHGHLFYSDVKEIHLAMQPKIITWMREPVERVISNYYFLMRQLRTDHRHAQKHMIDFTLLEYARESRRNKMSLYLEGIEPEKLFFIGFQENFQDDLEELAGRLGWQKPLPQVHLNSAGDEEEKEDFPTRRIEITESMKKEIRELNMQDIALYERVKSLRAAGG